MMRVAIVGSKTGITALTVSVVLLGIFAGHPFSAPSDAGESSAKSMRRAPTWYPPGTPLCEVQPWFCPDVPYQYLGEYIGHDEPGLMFYSNTPGSGNSAFYTLTIPTEPPTRPKQDGTGGTWNFQLHAAFWFGMVLCDPQSSPEFTSACTPDSDTNIFDDPDPNSPAFVGHQPGAAYLEMQFYPPGWVFGSATQWSAAIAIFEFSYDPNHGKFNNPDCLNKYGEEPAQQVFITTNGLPGGPELSMNPGDVVQLQMFDTQDGLKVIINDSKGTNGSMSASSTNAFHQVVFDPSAE